MERLLRRPVTLRRHALIGAALLYGTVAVPAADAASKPDLRILSVRAATVAVSGARIVVATRIVNSGRARAGASTVRLSSSRGAKLRSFHVPVLSPNQSLVRRVKFAPPPGRYAVVACADALRRVSERSERNNCVRTRTLSIAPVPPRPTIREQPAALTNSTTARLSFSGRGLFECSLDGTAFAACVSPVEHSALKEGLHAFRVRARAPGGRRSRAVRATWRVDVTPPAAPRILEHPPTLTSSPTASFAVEAEAGTSLACRVDAGAFVSCSRTETYRLPEGRHEFAVRARDGAGNEGPAQSFHWRIDLTPPPAPLVTERPPAATYVRSGKIAFGFPTPAEPTTRACRFDDSAVSCAAPLSLPGPLKPGRHVLSLVARDEAGNEATANVDWTILRRDDGIYGGPGGPQAVATFAIWRGTPVHRALEYLRKDAWGDISGVKAKDVVNRWRGSPYGLVLSTPMLPDTGGTLQAGARGDYDTHFDALARTLVAAGQRDAVIRLGWEFNGDWFSWSAVNDPAAFITFWRRVVTTMRAVSSDFRFDWCPNSGPSKMDADLAYPGDAFVDYVGMSSFDAAWGAPTPPTAAWRWGAIRDQPFGLAWQRAFAAAHHKPMTYPEWGLWKFTDPSYYNGGGSDGQDDPYYIERMFEWLNANEVAYALYFDYDSPVGIHRLGNFPTGAARYRALFGSL